MSRTQRGFTLVEMMLVVAIIGILAAEAIPKFADLLERSREGATKGNLGTLRSAVNNYYADQAGVFPQTPLDSTTWGTAVPAATYPAFLPVYIEVIPPVKVTGKNTANAPYNGRKRIRNIVAIQIQGGHYRVFIWP